ncbi:MAG: DEAD/DEAH box helicase, partial [Chthoniobacter sp.]|uniref:DEAD/DEAH box helicase n=1 Tax=Chthoniobacter sp. TaxID=2510640 RepID=UPI0032ABC934
ELVAELRKPGKQTQIIIAKLSVFRGGKLENYQLKRRLLLAALFRHWGPGFRHDARERLLKGAPDDWPRDSRELENFTAEEAELLPFDFETMRNLLTDCEELSVLQKICRELSEPYRRDRDTGFAEVEKKLNALYRLLCLQSLKRALPLIIVDEAHHWKNGANGFAEVKEHLCPIARRLLLLTATPFQLATKEMLDVLAVADTLEPCGTKAASKQRQQALREHREHRLKPALVASETASQAFSRKWAGLPRSVSTEQLEAAWRQIEKQTRTTDDTAALHPDMQPFMQVALDLFAANGQLSKAQGRVVIRHRRTTNHRWVLAGSEFTAAAQERSARPDRHVLHAAPGLDATGDAELPLYLLMLCVSLMKEGKGKSSLGANLTGCYSTLHASQEGRELERLLRGSQEGQRYLKMLRGLVREQDDPQHPKVKALAAFAMQCWHAGEKVLIFCTRVHTAERLHTILRGQVKRELAARARRCLGGEEALRSLHTRLTGRDRDLVTLGLDRVLWSAAKAFGSAMPLTADELRIEDSELPALARLALRCRVDLAAERVDRVFVHRATEHLIALRLLAQHRLHEHLLVLAEESWITHPYGLDAFASDEEKGGETARFDERGVHTVYRLGPEPQDTAVQSLASKLRATRQNARKAKQVAVLDAYALAPSLWLGRDPEQAPAACAKLHQLLWQLTLDDDASLDFTTRLLVMQALRRTVLRDTVLLRLLPGRAERAAESWGELLAEKFHEPLPHQQESMADRCVAFLEDLRGASGHVNDASTRRGSLYQATRLRADTGAPVTLVTGTGSAAETRTRIFTAFNTPLSPDILICTQVGQEGIDLHRHCRHVVHYDLAWNPALVEQRTGRIDRIGSKTFRERDLTALGQTVFLEVGLPYLAGTYDERMFEELRLRAQTFEVLTGGDFSADHAEEWEASDAPDDSSRRISAVPLPTVLLDDLRVRLAVWLK